ncbi:MAG: phospho-sugar mutase [Ruminococcaceae bacterium]|nr:phospho-sugar mutase [Oscillospiraceae bacterium]
MKNALTQYEKWISSPYLDEETKKALLKIKGNDEEIAIRFAAPMEFGTAGLRSVMREGISGMNVYTVAQTTQALALLIKEQNAESRGVAIAHDSRNNSELFAKIAAEVLAFSGIKVYFFDDLRPTPELSFAILEYGCISGINITASHNTKEYNGYKVYWEDGAQLPPAHATTVSEKASKLDIFEDVHRIDFNEGVKEGLIKIIGSETDERFLAEIMKCRISPDATKNYGDSLNMIYTPVHGTGTKLVPELLKLCGINNLKVVESQRIPDGNFPTVASPNPENPECFNEAKKLDKETGGKCELIVATDPDADRTGVTIKSASGEYITLTGNQIGALLVDYIIKGKIEAGTLEKNSAAIRSVVSSPLFDAICQSQGVKPMCVLTGFKYIGEKIKEFLASGEHTFIFGYEESFGFLSGAYSRDKDAVGATMLIAEMASFFKAKGLTLWDVLQDLYKKHGFYEEKTVSVAIGGIDPMSKMREIMGSLRNDPPKAICSMPTTALMDYKSRVSTDITTGEKTADTSLPVADMLKFTLKDGTSVLVRPSGTEPKIKIYILASHENKNTAEKMCEDYSSFMKDYLQKM